MVIAEVSGGSGDSEVIPSGKVNSVNGETRFPGSLIGNVVTDTQSISFIPGVTIQSSETYLTNLSMFSPDGYQSLIVLVPELQFTATDNLMSSVAIVVVSNGPVVDDCREVGMLVIVRTVVVTVGICQYGQTTEQVPGPEDRTKGHPLLDVPESEAVPKEISGGSRHFETQLHLYFIVKSNGIVFYHNFPLPTSQFLVLQGTLFQMAPCLDFSSAVSLIKLLLTMVLPTKSQFGIPKPAPVKSLVSAL